MLQSALKILFIIIIITIIPVVIFSYEIFSVSNKIFVSENNDSSAIKQFSEMIFSPTQSLDGEENGRINVLLLGVGGEGHNGGQLTDTIMIASIKPQENEVALISIPRDLFVQIPELGTGTKINAVKTISEKNGKDGNKILKELIEEISGLKIQYYAQLDFKGFTKIVDDAGGIDIELENDINDPSYPNFNNGYDPFYITKGWHHLDGATALKVARSRHSRMGDFDRIKRQQAVIKSFKQRVYEKYEKMDLFALKNILLDVGNHLSTDIEPKEIPRFYSIFKNVKSHKITAESIDTQKYLSRTYIGLGYTLESKSKDYNEIKNLSNNVFDLAVSDERKGLIKDEKANIEIQNGTSSPDLANTVAQDLESFGFRIINSTNINDPNFSGVKIYDNSKGLKPETLKLLKEKFSAIIADIPKTMNSNADFSVVLGNGF